MTDNNHAPRAGRRTGLVALNAALLMILSAVVLVPSVDAQLTTPNARVRGDYTVVGGQTLGDTASTVYVLDSANRDMVALRWNDSSKSLEGVGYRDLVRDVQSDPDR